MERQGKIKHWDDPKGFGFIHEGGGSEDLFFHIRDVVASDRRPNVGELVTFRRTQDGAGRPRAVHVLFEGRRSSRSEPVSTGSAVSVLISAIFLVGLGISALIGFSSMLLAGWYLLLSLVSYLVYVGDKAAAQSGGWRTPEQTLHFLGLLGGWPGAWIARERKRHKTKKISFRIVFWLTVMINLAAFYGFHTAVGAQLLDWLAGELRGVVELLRRQF